MPNEWKKIRRVFAIHWSDAIQYRTDMVAWTLVGALTPLISLAIWYTVSLNSSSGPNPQTIFAYYIMIIITTQLTSSWHGLFMSQDILNGQIVKHLMRPFPYFWHPFANNIVEKSIRFPFVFIGLIALVALQPTTIFTNITLNQILTYLLSLTLAITVSFFFMTSLGLLAFWLEDAREILRLRILLESMTSGLLIPYSFMPEKLATAFSLLPFRYIFATPAELFVGQIQGPDITKTLSIQVAWGVFFIILATILWRQGLKRYAIPGQ